MYTIYKSQYTGEQIDELLTIVFEKKDILVKMSTDKDGNLLYDGYPVLIESAKAQEE